MRYRKIICKYCGESATVSTMRKADYCNKAECKILAHNEAAKKSYQKSTSFIREEDRIISTEAVDDIYITDIEELAKELGDIQFKIIQKIQAEVRKEQNINKKNDKILHSIEFSDLSDDDIKSIINEIHIDRKERRQTKIRRTILQELVAKQGIKNPHKFVKEAITGAKNTRHFSEHINSLRKNKDIYRVEEKSL